MSKQTAVQWLEQEFIALQNYSVNELGLFAKAKEMEKQQIIQSNRDGTDMVIVDGTPFITGEQYYNKTFNK